ncbi:MAG TPA: OpgC domain-containing protein [Magnetospirillaceae bacterium]|jgi:hypothetical protein
MPKDRPNERLGERPTEQRQSEHKHARRDPRVDVMRGLALLMIFIDHVQGNVLGFTTLHMFGLSDAAEVFVMLSGFSSMAAYGQIFENKGARAGLLRVGERCLRIYLFQAGLLVAAYLLITAWAEHYYVLIPELIPFMNGGAQVVKHGLTLRALPAKLDILPLYILLFSCFPVIYLFMRWSMALTVAASGGLWLWANLDPSLNLTNHMDGTGWFFDPFAWQFIFVLGAAGYRAMRYYEGSLPYRWWLAAACWGYLLFALLALAPWYGWGLSDYRPYLVPSDKQHLSVLRLLDVLAMMYLALSSQKFLQFARLRVLAWIDACGRHSLEVFSLGTLLAMAGSLVITSFGRAWPIQIAVNLFGFAALIGLALAMEAHRRRARQHVEKPAIVAPAPAEPTQLSQATSCVAVTDMEQNGAWSVSPAPAVHASAQPSLRHSSP